MKPGLVEHLPPGQTWPLPGPEVQHDWVDGSQHMAGQVVVPAQQEGSHTSHTLPPQESYEEAAW